jgi:hypothetical protein
MLTELARRLAAKSQPDLTKPTSTFARGVALFPASRAWSTIHAASRRTG